jgi:hypothetical protein
MFLSDFPAIFSNFSSMFDMKSIPSAPPGTPMAHGTCPPPSPPSPSAAPRALCAAPGAAGAHGTAPRRRGRTPRNGRQPLDGEFFEENGEKNMETIKQMEKFHKFSAKLSCFSIFFLGFLEEDQAFLHIVSHTKATRALITFWAVFVQNRSNA